MCRHATRSTQRRWSNEQQHRSGPSQVSLPKSRMQIVWRLLVVHLAAIWWLLRVNAQTVTSFECCFLCVAHCLKNSTNGTMESCKDNCFKYSYSDSCSSNSSLCWKSLIGSVCRSTSDAPRHPPFNLMVEYYEDPYPEPYIAELSWSPVQSADLYVVQYKDMDDEFTSFGLQEIMFVQRPDAIFKKPRLCPTYGFRIAAVNRFGVSNFSDVERIDRKSIYGSY
ncbi:hypothetical protein M514_25584 [Trichuris suis]|uniref:Fibronectin type-III domain-containing protein n=1 Tax=Trichuris suis TaxID=68888 RepID=A0A085MYH5_9BILA|nr:hypothetical protein M514_25584 [Trichuris suis]